MIKGIGTDLIEIIRVEKAIARTLSFKSKIFTLGEQQYCESHKNSAERYAVRWAAKEAVMKALGVGISSVAFADIEVINADSGAPEIVLSGKAKSLADSLDIEVIHISLSHTKDLAQAFVIASG